MARRRLRVAGKTFAQFASGVKGKNPQAVAAVVFRKKFGTKRLAKASARGRKR